MSMAEDAGYRELVQSHERTFGANRYVYPVLSRRSAGMSIGVNLSPDLACDFRCVYCQVNREGEKGDRHLGATSGEGADRSDLGASPPVAREKGDRHLDITSGEGADRSDLGASPRFPIDLGRLGQELDRTVELVVSGRIYESPKFGTTPVELRRLNDIALSGNGEPTLCGQFEQVVEICADVRRRRGPDDVKLVLITNATLLHEERVQRGLKILDANNGEIWAKLDAGTEAYYRRVARSEVPFQRVLDNLAQAAQTRPIVVQTLFMRLDGQPPAADEVLAYCDRLGEITATGGRIKLVQVHTVARAPAESWVAALPDDELAALGDLVRGRTGLEVAVYPSYSS